MNTSLPDAETIKAEVRRRYGAIAQTDSEGSGTAAGTCCGTSQKQADSCGCSHDEQGKRIGYSEQDLAAVPEGANLGLGCGNPLAIASLRPGQTVLDLGSGAGFDAFLAARAVGASGHVIGVDMTPEMVSKARANANRGGYSQVEFRLGEIEALPVANETVDVVISNCVVNLCPDKRPVYREAFRVLKPGGRIAISDVVARRELPVEVRNDLALHAGCLAGATLESELQRILKEAGFADIVIRPRSNSVEVITSWEAKKGFEENVFAAEVLATKPETHCCKS